MSRYLIWSHEHQMWWRENREGYTVHMHEAGVYDWKDAAQITLDHIPPGEEVAINFEVAARHGSAVVWAALLDDPDYHIEKRHL